ncbi:MAG: beta-lactamase family protein [Chloroflexi bacterium]|nr:beta-lactamase family protein [Chloroflexota bacterium]
MKRTRNAPSIARLPLAFVLTLVAAVLMAPGVLAQGETTYTAPDGGWTVPVPGGWTTTEGEGYVQFSSGDGMDLFVLTFPDGDVEDIAPEAWALVDSEFDLTYEPNNVQRITDEVLLQGYDSAGVITYANGTGADGKIVQAAVQSFNGTAYVILIDTDLPTLQRRVAQLQIFSTGFLPAGFGADDLSAAEVVPFDTDFFEEVDAFVADAHDRLNVDSVAYAVVRDGEIVHTAGFGTQVDGDPVTADTHFMIGSITKTMTTLLMAQAIDQGAFTWETPVIEIDPAFAVADPEISAQLTMSNLVCACTGVPRRDYELIYNPAVPADEILAQLETFEFFTGFGEAFQYSNQLVAAAGYETARALDPDADDLLDAYIALVQDGIFGPVGMTETTFDFDAIAAGERYSLPYGRGALEYEPLSIETESFLLSVAPAGAAWSTANDMASYLVMLMNGGVTADGTRVVSEEGLARVQTPQVSIDSNTSYGLGWILGEYKEVPVYFHDGNTLGYSASMTYMPDKGIGIVVLVNQQGSSAPGLIASNFYSLALADPEPDAAGTLDFIVTTTADNVAKAEDTVIRTFDAEVVGQFAGTYANPVLGEITLTVTDDNGVTFDAGEFVTALWRSTEQDDPEVYFMADPPLTGDRVRLALGEDGDPRVVVGLGLTEYVFTLTK